MTRHAAWLLVTAGQGPAECAWAAARVVERIVEEASAAGIEARVTGAVAGPERDTLQSAVVALESGMPCETFLSRWHGTVQVVARSTFRPQHRRKNWFVGVQALEPVVPTRFRVDEVGFETMRSQGAGGQHVNTTDSAVRVTHLPTGLQAVASEERSQHRNKALALARLEEKLAARDDERRGEAERRRWRAHHELQRGNPVRVLGSDQA